jgi:ATP-dependent RNA helicase DeaD
MSQGSRDGVMLAFKGGRDRLLVATDVAARGLDISGVTHVVNYDIPNSPDVYVHRIGRTGRVGRSGRAITLITARQRKDLKEIEHHAKTEIREWSPNGKLPAPKAAEEAPPEPVGADDHLAEPHEELREVRRPRHTKPRREVVEPLAKLIVSAGRSHGVEPKDVVGAIVDATDLDGEDVRDVRVLERFSFAHVPEGRAEEVAGKVNGTNVRGVELRVEVVNR